MKDSYHILQLEDNIADAQLIQIILKDDGINCSFDVIDTREEFIEALNKGNYDCILADYTLPAFDAHAALNIFKTFQYNIPFIIVSGTIGEEFAIESIKAGATDYVLKNKLQRLPTAFLRAIRESEELKKRIESEIRYSSVVNSMAEGVLLVDQEGLIITFNPMAIDIMGSPQASSLEGRRVESLVKLVSEQGIPIPQDQYPSTRTLKTGIPCIGEIFGFKNPDDEMIWVRLNTQPVIAPNKTVPHGAVISFADITKSLEATQELQRSQALLELVHKTAQIGHIEYSPASDEISWSKEVYRILDLEPEKTTPSLKIIEELTLIPPKNMESSLSLHDIYTRNPDTTFELLVLSPSGDKKYLSTRSTSITNRHGKESVIITLQDISQQKKTEEQIRELNDKLEKRVKERTEALRQSEEKYRLISENMNDLIIIIGENQSIQYASPSLFSVLGYTGEDLLKVDKLQLIHPEDEGLATVIFKQLFEGQEMARLQARWKKKDNSYIWLETIGSILGIENGKVTSILTSSRDISAAKEAEKEMTKALEKERELHKLKSSFVTTISHQFRTPISSIKTNVEILKLLLRSGKVDEMNERLESIFNRSDLEVKRLIELMDEILILGRHEARKTPFQPVKLKMVAFIQELIDKVIELSQKKEQIIFECNEKEFSCFVDPILFEQSITNLLNNALKYSPGDSPPLVRLKQQEEQVVVQVADKGIGIPEKELQNLFQSFYRASNATDVPGTGLGLVIAKEFVQLHGGTIQVESEVNKGSTFTVKIPLRKIAITD